MRYTDWSITYYKDKAWVVRWCVDGTKRKLQRLPIKQYQLVRDNPEELKNLVIRLNNKTPEEVHLKAKLDIQHAYISPKLLVDYYNYIVKKIPNKRNARRNFGYLNTHVLGYFIRNRKIQDPIKWHSKQDDWREYLEKQRLSPSCINQIVVEINRFIAWLHLKRPTEVQPINFKPFDRYQMKHYKAVWKMEGRARDSKYLWPEDAEKIRRGLKDRRLKAAFELAYRYGLREAEVMGLKLDDVWDLHLKVERQLLSLPSPDKPDYGPLKGREARITDHWNATAQQAYDWILTIQEKLMIPNTLCARWRIAMKELKLDYHFHDARHGFITDALDNHTPREVQLAVGHKDISTTMGYAHDNRRKEARPFKPKIA